MAIDSPARARVADAVRRHALAHPAWGHRKVWAMCRHDGHRVSQATVLRLLRDEGLLLEASYQRERRQLAARRRAAFATEPTGPNQVWQLDFTEFETTTGGTWRLAGCRDHYSKYELGWHVSPTANQHDAVAAVEAALTESARLAGQPLVDLAARDANGGIQPLVPIVTDNGGPFRSFRFEAFIAAHPELRHVRTRVRSPGQNGSRERGFGTHQWLMCCCTWRAPRPSGPRRTSPRSSSSTWAGARRCDETSRPQRQVSAPTRSRWPR